MTEQQIREAAAAAVADFPPIPDEVVARLGAILAPLDDNTQDGGGDGATRPAEAA